MDGGDTAGMSGVGDDAEEDDAIVVGVSSLACASDKNDDGAGARGVRGENTELEEYASSAANIDFGRRVDDENSGSLGLNWKSDDEMGGVGVEADKGDVASLIDLLGNPANFLCRPFVTVAVAGGVGGGLKGVCTDDTATLLRRGVLERVKSETVE